MNILERSHLEILLALEERGTLTAAAESLHLTQPALSHTMQKLENLLGVELWYRRGRNILPTQAGEYLLSTARRMVPQFRHAEERLHRFATGEMGTLRIGIECHPCYQWLLKITAPYLASWPRVDLDVRQRFQFGGLGALFQYEIDLLITPDPLEKPGISYTPVFDYEQVLVVGSGHPLAGSGQVLPGDLAREVLITYPIAPDRLDIYTQFLTPAGQSPRKHKTIENTEIIFQMVAGLRGVAALPRWLVEENREKYAILPLRLGQDGVQKKLYVGYREADREVDYMAGFLAVAEDSRNSGRSRPPAST